ncbi:MAG: hypothetical protein LLF92_03340 [Planctomycetaceae bacterium]|nr:hypothetical protein [Planctomycetaceae bacterium]
MADKQYKIKKLELSMSMVAIVISILVPYLATKQANKTSEQANKISEQANEMSKKAMEIATQANEIAKQGNSIALGSRFEIPEVRMLLSDTEIDLSMFEKYKKQPINLYIENVSKVPISGVSVTIYVASKLFYCEIHPEDALENVNPLEFELPFKQEVLPKGYAIADIRKPLFEYLGKISKDFKYQEDVYSGLMHMVVKPYKTGSSLPIQQPNQKNSEVDIGIRCRAKSFNEEKDYIASLGINMHYSNRDYEGSK